MTDYDRLQATMDSKFDAVFSQQAKQAILLARIDERQEAMSHRLDTHLETPPSAASEDAVSALKQRVESLESHINWLWRSLITAAFASLTALSGLGKKLGLS